MNKEEDKDTNLIVLDRLLAISEYNKNLAKVFKKYHGYSHVSMFDLHIEKASFLYRFDSFMLRIIVKNEIDIESVFFAHQEISQVMSSDYDIALTNQGYALTFTKHSFTLKKEVIDAVIRKNRLKELLK